MSTGIAVAIDVIAELRAAYEEYKPAEKKGLAFGERLHTLRAGSEVVQGGTSFAASLDAAGIPRRTAYYWIHSYEISIGEREPRVRKPPQSVQVVVTPSEPTTPTTVTVTMIEPAPRNALDVKQSVPAPLPETFVTAAEVAAAGMWLADFLKASNGVAKADTVRRASQKAGLDWNAVITARDKMTGEHGSHWVATWYTEDYAPAMFKQEINPAAEAWLRKELNGHTNLEMSSQQAFALGKKNGFSADAIHTAATALGVIQGTPNQWGYPLWTLPVAESVPTDVVTDAVAEAAALCPDVSDILAKPEYAPASIEPISEPVPNPHWTDAPFTDEQNQTIHEICCMLAEYPRDQAAHMLTTIRLLVVEKRKNR